MSAGAANLVDHVLPDVPIRQLVLTLPFPLRFPLAFDGKLLGQVLRIFTGTVTSRDRLSEVPGAAAPHRARQEPGHRQEDPDGDAPAHGSARASSRAAAAGTRPASARRWLSTVGRAMPSAQNASFRHMSLRALALYAQRIGRVFAAVST